MRKVLLFGASGNLGREIAKAATQRGHAVTAVVRSLQKAAQLAPFTADTIIADVTSPEDIKGICKGFEVVISALGKSVSPAEKSRPTFYDIDMVANSRILEDAVTQGGRKFVYVSAFGAEQYPQLTYFQVHHQFSEKLKQSGIDYSIVKPPALFSAFVEMIDMARKGMLVNMGSGEKKTNPIFEGDLAEICVDAMEQHHAVIEAGGKNIYTRRQLLHIIQQEVAPAKKVWQVPMGLIKFWLPLIKLADRNMYDKLAFFTAVMQHDTIAPQVGPTRFEDYIKEKANSKKHDQHP